MYSVEPAVKDFFVDRKPLALQEIASQIISRLGGRYWQTLNEKKRACWACEHILVKAHFRRQKNMP